MASVHSETFDDLAEEEDEDGGMAAAGGGGGSAPGGGEANSSRKRKPSLVAESDKVYVCCHPGCGKSFMRSDHLSRHKLNHEPSQIFRCDRCPRTFVRPDLLKRHAERHDKREQSGLHSQPKPGRIKGSTSKKRQQPSFSSSRQSPPNNNTLASAAGSARPSSLQAGTAEEGRIASGFDDIDFGLSNSAPGSVGSFNTPLPSPPIIDNYDHDRFTDLLAPRLRRSPSPEASANLLLDFSHIINQLNYSHLDGSHGPTGAQLTASLLQQRAALQNGVAASNNLRPSFSSIPPSAPPPAAPPPPPPLPPSMHQIQGQVSVQPSAMLNNNNGHININSNGNNSNNINGNSSNFNASFDFGTTYAVASSNFDTPFLSASESNWLFNDGELKFDTKMPQPMASGMSMMPMASPQIQTGTESPFMRSASALPMRSTTPAPPNMPTSQQQSAPSSHLTSRPSTSTGGSGSGSGSGAQQLASLSQNGSYNLSSSYPNSLAGILNTNGRKKLHVHFADGGAGAQQSDMASMSANFGLNMPNSAPSASNGMPYLPLQPSGVSTAQPATARTINIGLATRNRLAKHLTALPNLLSDHRFSATSLDEYMARFFQWDACHYSAIHRATFEPDEASNHLLSAMLAIGAYFTSSEGHDLAESIHRTNLQSFLSSPDFCARADMQAIQASLFLDVFGRMMSSYDDHEKAHILFPAFLTMYRRSALFNTRNSPVPPGADLHSRWIAWREEESSKRAAFMAYQFDIVCNAMFRQTGTLSAFQVQLTLPCFEEEWYAPTATDWHKIHSQRSEPPPFLTTMKAFLMPGLNSPEISPLARVVCLHGLLSVAFDMQWREYFLLGLSTHPDGLVKDWRPTLTSAYNCWKTRFDAALTRSPTAIGTQLLRNSIPIYAIAHVTLAVDVDELQIFAGKRRALGLPVPASVVDTTRRRIISWSSVRGKEAVWHAAHFLRSSLLTRRSYQDGNIHPTFLSWCLYLSCLCVHAYSTAASLAASMPEVPELADASDPLAYLDVICASPPDAINLPRSATAAPVCLAISRVLKEDTNWELAQEASQLLRKVAHEGS